MPEGRTEAGTFKTGCSGNPGGRRKKDEVERRAEDLFRERSLEAAEELIAMAWNVETPVKVRVDILKHILDRALGKPRISGEIDVNTSVTPAGILREIDERARHLSPVEELT